MSATPGALIRAVLALGLALAILCVAAAPSADPLPEAERLARQALVAFDKGNYLEAARLYASANRLAPKSSVKYNEAFSWQRAGDKVRAANAYREALALGGLGPQVTATVRQRLEALKGELGTLVVPCPVGGQLVVPPTEQLGLPAKLSALPGEHVIEISGPGIEPKRQVVRLEPGATITVTEHCQTKTAAVPDASATRAATPERAPDRPRSKRRIAAWALAGVSASTLTGAVVLHVSAARAADRFHDDGSADPALRDRALRLRRWTAGTYTAAAALAALGTLLLVTSSDPGGASAGRRPGGPSIAGRAGWRVTVGASPAGLLLSGERAF